MTDTLWAPWRMEYLRSSRKDDCVFCTALAAGAEKHSDNLILHADPKAFVMLNRFPYTYAHILVLPSSHVDCLEKLNRPEQQAFLSLVLDAQTIVRKLLNPQGINVGINIGAAAGAGIEDHLHAHIVPRWNGDTNFMPLLAESRVMPEHLDATYQKLVDAFAELAPPVTP